MKTAKSVLSVRLFGLAALVAAITIAMTALSLTGCDNGSGPGGGNTPTVTTVTVSPPTASVAKGGTQDFTATVTGTNNPAQTVTWSIEQADKNAGTDIDANGNLTVAAAETLSSLTVKATSTVDTSKSGTATVTVTDGSTVITYTLSQAGGVDGVTDSTGIEFTFSGSIDSLGVTAADIAVSEAAEKGVAATFEKSSGNNWLLSPITVNEAGLATVKITKTGIEAAVQTVLVYQDGTPAPEYWTVTWNLNGGTAGSGSYPTQIKKGDVLAKPSPDPAKGTDTFGGWYTNSGLTTAYNFTNNVTANLNLYAKWNPPAGNLTLAGNVTITPNTGVTTGTPLTAHYSGTDTAVTFAWHKQGTAASVASGTTYTPTEAGSYAVTASAEGYDPKTSDPVTVMSTDGTIAVEFGGFGDEEIDLTLSTENDLSQSLEQSLIVTVVNDGQYDRRWWFIDGSQRSSGDSYTLNARDLTLGIHTVAVVVSLDGKFYSKELTFRVVR